nr:PREDICTED: protein spitz-like isoform X1 [Bemisia tabaci]
MENDNLICESRLSRTWPSLGDFVQIVLASISRFYRFLARFSGRRRRSGLKAAPCSMRLALPYFVLLVFSYLAAITDACSSRSTPKPRPPLPTARPNITFDTYVCPPNYAKEYCLSGGTCFTVKIGESILFNCECADGFMGQRCEFKDLEGSYLPTRKAVLLETASIASGATIAVLLVVFAGVSMYIHIQRRHKQQRLAAGTCCVDGSGGDIERRLPFARRCNSAPLTKIPRANLHSQRAAVLSSAEKGDCVTSSVYISVDLIPPRVQPSLQTAPLHAPSRSAPTITSPDPQSQRHIVEC